ncbi:putative membrane bound cation transporter [Aspergillus clavatus NRRL 1]|uniref:Sodium/calcium transporter, putative n=1 Tax=Aspergillus clavatus (strain ATCC 1007 / CBS 513.65 / DSM 816 / NCTC 3887 / NRRL 1 / QM 1276 / 107) TaxID=344612 RepID=A1C9F2_ASPCL|nr:sodium/calcium transporter, putative [Aspergillus clavatus NRRL 1]EAW13476.1 sodium/calcium transporter, putative [Aspergillus clavatus NRRL 1]
MKQKRIPSGLAVITGVRQKSACQAPSYNATLVDSPGETVGIFCKPSFSSRSLTCFFNGFSFLQSNIFPSFFHHPHLFHYFGDYPFIPRSATQDPSKQPPSTTQDSEAAEPRHHGQVNEQPADLAGPGSNPPNQQETSKRGLGVRFKDGIVRFGRHTKTALFHSWVNVLLIFVPIGIAVEAAGLDPAIIFAMNAVAIIPLAGILSHATECVAMRLGDTVGALINVTFGNAVELIIFIALVKNEIRIVQASLLGSILANLLLILGMAFLLGGLRFQEQIYNSTVTQMSACLLSLSVTSLLLPTAFHASFSNGASADRNTLKVSRGTSVVLLLVYILYIIFQLKSHSYLYASIPQQIIDEESHPGVLAEFMNSSSDSSSSSSSDSDDTTTSWTTAKRIKRAMRHRRRRKSSTSSNHTSSAISGKKSPADSQPVLTEKRSSTEEQSSGHSADAVTYAIDFADDGHYEADDDNRHQSRSVDFGQGSIGEHEGSKKDRKAKKRAHKKQKALKKEQEKNGVKTNGSSAHRPPLPSYVSAPVSDRMVSSPSADESAGLPKKSLFRPTMPSLLSNTVFSATNANNVAPTSGNPPGLRRTRSLPSQMNRPPPVGNAVQFARGAARIPTTSDVVTNNVAPEHEMPEMSRTAAVVMLLVSTALVAVCAEFLVDAIPEMIKSSSVSEAFIGLIILPIVGNAAEHVTAVSVATKNKMDLSIGVSVGSSIQIAIFVTPLVVILGWCMDKDMSLYFTLFETICLFVTAFVVNFLVLDGRSNYLEGALLIAAYVIIAVAAFFYPPPGDQSIDVASAGSH